MAVTCVPIPPCFLALPLRQMILPFIGPLPVSSQNPAITLLLSGTEKLAAQSFVASNISNEFRAPPSAACPTAGGTPVPLPWKRSGRSNFVFLTACRAREAYTKIQSSEGTGGLAVLLENDFSDWFASPVDPGIVGPVMSLLPRLSIPRIRSSAVAVLLIGFPLRLRAESATAWTTILTDAGQPRRFEIAPDELHLKARAGASSLHRITPEPGLDQLRARAKRLAAASGGEVKLVLYPVGRPRDALTRRLLTRKILLLLRPDADAAAILNGVSGLVQWRSLDYLPGAVLVE